MTNTTRWGGHLSRKARGGWRSRVEAGVPCCRCGKPVVPRPWLPHDGWEPDHYPVPWEFGGTETWPAHSECNGSAGGKRGAQITNARRTESKAQASKTDTTPDRRRIRGV